jgi:hypothetical protein
MASRRRSTAGRRKVGLDSLQRRFNEWVESVADSENDELIAQLLDAALKLSRDSVDRGELKILARALKELRYAFEVFAPYRAVRKVSIFGSTRVPVDHPYYRMAAHLGRRLAEEGFMIITGAGPGIMQAGHEGAGPEKSFGVNIHLPFEQKANAIIRDDPKLITFHFFFTRKLLFVKEADAVVFFPGGFGTHDEAVETLTLVQTGKSQTVPIVFVDLPGENYWRGWEGFVRREMLGRGFISPQDTALFKVFEDVEGAVREIRDFYRNYHSARFVGETLVVRTLRPFSPETVSRLNREFRDILTAGEIVPIPAFPDEDDEPESLHLHRLAVPFNRRDFGRLRQFIDAVNSFPAESA